MKKLLIVLTALAFIAGIGVMKAEAANPATIGVTVTLTLAELNVSVTPTIWEPTLAAIDATTSQVFAAKNETANRTEDLSIICSTGSNPWSIGPSAGVDTFKMTAAGGDLGTPTSIDTLKTLKTDLAAQGTVNVTLEFTRPTSTDKASDSMTVTINAL